MTPLFTHVLKATGFLAGDGRPVPGLLQRHDKAALQARTVFEDRRVGLEADAVFRSRNATLAIFKDATDQQPAQSEVLAWHEAAWNVGVAPLLWIVTPTCVELYDCYRAPHAGDTAGGVHPIGVFGLDPDALEALEAACGRLATETGAFWSSPIGRKIDRKHRVDQELLKEIRALESLLTALPPREPQDLTVEAEIQASRDLAQRLIGRCIFSWYLLDRQIVSQFWPRALPTDLAKVFETTQGAFALFDWLRASFNGDLFPMDDPGAERARLSERHLGLLRDFVAGRSLSPEDKGQGRLFRFRFDAIPVDLISAIYQQFARTSAAKEAEAQGLHYTPIELVHLTLDPVFEDLGGDARVIDPTCGSGAFLVEAFRRLVWKRAGHRPPRREEIRAVLYDQVYGVDINRSALGIAAFSLYLAALELDTDPIDDLADLKFHRLIGRTLFEADALDTLPEKVSARPFAAVVGNPPWTFDSTRSTPRGRRGAATPRPRRSPDQLFLRRAAELAGGDGRVGMVMKASPFFSREEHAVEARNALLETLKPTALVNLSALRRENLFPDAVSPALLFFARCALMPGPEQVLVGSAPWTPDFRRSGIVHIGPGELRPTPLARILQSPAVLKAAAFGGARDVWLIDRLEREHLLLADLLDRADYLRAERRGQGFQVHGPSAMIPPDAYYHLPVLEARAYSAFRLDPARFGEFRHQRLQRTRNPSLFEGPILICPKGNFTAAGERGRYSAAVYSGDLLYSESFFGVSFKGRDPRWAHVLSGILNSSVTAFQLALAGGGWGLERSTVEPKDLMTLRVPDLSAVEPERLDAVIAAEAAAAEVATPDALARLDQAVADLYDLDPDEAVLTVDSIARARMLVFESSGERRRFVQPPSRDTLTAYAAQLTQVIDRFLRARGERHLEATIFSRPLARASWTSGDPGLTAIRLNMAPGRPDMPIVHVSDGVELEGLAERLLGNAGTDLLPYLNERRQMRLYVGDALYVLKPSETRCWDRAAGLNDADLVLADHWLRGAHAVGA